MSSTAIVKNKSNNTLFIVTNISKSSTFKEFVSDIPSYFPIFADEIQFQVIALIDTDQDPLIQTFEKIQLMSQKNFFKTLIKMGTEFADVLKGSEDAPIDAAQSIKVGLSNLERDIALKF